MSPFNGQKIDLVTERLKSECAARICIWRWQDQHGRVGRECPEVRHERRPVGKRKVGYAKDVTGGQPRPGRTTRARTQQFVQQNRVGASRLQNAGGSQSDTDRGAAGGYHTRTARAREDVELDGAVLRTSSIGPKRVGGGVGDCNTSIKCPI